MKLVRQYPHGGKHPPEAVADPKLAPSNLSPSMQLYGFEDGPVTMRPDLLLDAVGVGELARLGYRGGKAGIEALKRILTSKSDDAMSGLAKSAEPYRLVKETASGRAEREALRDEVYRLNNPTHGSEAAKKAGMDPIDIAELKKSGMNEDDLFDFVTKTGNSAAAKAAREASEPAIRALRERIQKSKLQTQAQRAIQNASKEESQAILNLQGKLDKALADGVMEEQKAVKLFQEAVDKIFTQTRIDDILLKDGDTVAKKFGPTMKELYDTNRPMFDAIYNDLIKPMTTKKISGKPNPKMNEQGGRAAMPYRTIKRYA